VQPHRLDPTLDLVREGGLTGLLRGGQEVFTGLEVLRVVVNLETFYTIGKDRIYVESMEEDHI
jgi:hypothetical protein